LGKGKVSATHRKARAGTDPGIGSTGENQNTGEEEGVGPERDLKTVCREASHADYPRRWRTRVRAWKRGDTNRALGEQPSCNDPSRDESPNHTFDAIEVLIFIGCIGVRRPASPFEKKRE